LYASNGYEYQRLVIIFLDQPAVSTLKQRLYRYNNPFVDKQSGAEF
jgi:hypothetical protein